ncbi:MAG: hypothetical protein AAB656_03945 [Patescibacteria group bacterium]
MPRIEAVIFDVGNVLHEYDSDPIKKDIINTLQISEDVFSKIWNPLTIRLELGLISEKQYWEMFKLETGSIANIPDKALGIFDLFPIQIFSHQVGLRKPDHKILV